MPYLNSVPDKRLKMSQQFEATAIGFKPFIAQIKRKRTSGETKLTYVDSLRGVAVLMVILVHIAQKTFGLDEFTKQTAMYGQMGVQLFFVLSAYTLCLSVDRRKKDADPLLLFYIRRFFRIAPLYYFGILLYLTVNLALSRVHSGASRISDYTFPNVLSNVFFYHGFYPPAINNIVLGGWSIGAEMAFYSVFPFLFIAIKRISKNRLAILLMPFLGLVLSLTFFVLLSYIRKGTRVENNNVLYYNLINQFPVFLVGISYFFYEQNFSSKIKVPVAVHALCFCVLTLVTMYLFQINFNFTLLPFLAGLSFVFLIQSFKHIKTLNYKWLQRIGQLSFSMYILHFLFAYYATEYVTKYWLRAWPPSTSALLCFFMSALLTFGSALFTERFIERKGINLGKYVIARLNTRL